MAGMATDDLVVNRVHSASTKTVGRSINEVRKHQFVIDEPTHLGGPGQEITPADAFVSGVAACGVLMVQGRARDSGVRLDSIEVDLEAVRHRSDTSVFRSIEMRFRLVGPTKDEAAALVEHYKTH
jgi:uncharacterized OsmC-like protein